ncbi:hypothetical protein ACW2Q0_06800 [Nocardia sp. R16R-3T]
MALTAVGPDAPTIPPLDSADRVTLELCSAPPAAAERIADRVILTRK